MNMMIYHLIKNDVEVEKKIACTELLTELFNITSAVGSLSLQRDIFNNLKRKNNNNIVKFTLDLHKKYDRLISSTDHTEYNKKLTELIKIDEVGFNGNRYSQKVGW